MRCRITALTLILIMLMHSFVSAEYADVSGVSPVGIAVDRLSKLGILQGFGDGLFHPDETLTRAQFSKIAVYMLGEEDDAATRSANTVFSDVSPSFWASGYINYIAERDIINGYPDGTFGANDTINYAQVLTILVRLLGYQGEDVGYRWPDGYISKAHSLGITKDVSFDKYENVTRANAAYLAYNTLLAERKEGSKGLISSSYKEDVVIYADSTTDASLAASVINTTAGAFKLADTSTITSADYGMLGTIYLDSDSKAVAFVPERETKKLITIVSALNNSDTGKTEISYYENDNLVTESFSFTAPVYYDGMESSMKNASADMENGREAILFYSESGTFARMLMNESSFEGPVTITSDYSQIYSLFGLSSASAPYVYRKGEKAALSDIEKYDVCYYLRSVNTIYAYADKVTGTYEKAYPIKANVTSVTISGKDYNLASQKAISKMNESEGAFKIGDRVTLLLGRNGDCIDVVDLNSSGTLDIAVLSDFYSEISEEDDTKGERIRYAALVMPDGSEVVYECENDYSNYVGSVMKISYNSGIVDLTYVSPNVIYGAYNSEARTIAGHWLTDDCCILELLENPDKGKAVVKKVESYEIASGALSRSQVIHVQTTGAMDDISFLYLKDVTKSSSEFGVIRTSEGRNRYSVLYGSNEKIIETALKLRNGDAIEMQLTSDNKTEVKAMTKIAQGSSVAAYTTGRIRIGSETYTVSENVKIYGGVLSNKYSSMSVSEMLDGDNVERVTLYSDKSAKSGGIVRVIVVKTKK